MAVKVKGWGSFGRDTADNEAEAYETYDGPVPPKGLYMTSMKFLRLKFNKNDEHMLSGLFIINEPKKSPKAKYNGYAIWWNGNVTEQSSGYVNAFLAAMGYDKKKFWAGAIFVDDDGDDKKFVGTITKIGLKAVKEGTPIKINAKSGKDMEGEPNLQVASFVPVKPSEVEDEDDIEDDIDDEDLEDDEDYDDEEDEESEEDEDEEYDEDEDEEEEEEEPEPPKRSRASTSRTAGTRAKPAAKKAAPATRRRAARKTDEDDEPPF